MPSSEIFQILKDLVDFGTRESRMKVLNEIPINLIFQEVSQNPFAANLVRSFSEHGKQKESKKKKK